MSRSVANRVRGLVANADALKALARPLAGLVFGNPLARQLLETPGWKGAGTVPSAPTLPVACETTDLPGAPFAVASTADGKTVFVSVQEPGGNERVPGRIVVLRRGDNHLEVSHWISLAAAPWGLQLLRADSVLAVANSHGVVLIDAVAARDAGADPDIRTVQYGRDYYTTQVLASPDERILFASDEHNNTVTMIDIDQALRGASAEQAIVTQVPVDIAPVGMALSADGKSLFTTCEMQGMRAPDLANWLAFTATLDGRLRRAGTVCSIDLDRAVRDPETAILARPAAGGHPVRLAMARNGTVLFVSSRASDQFLAFDISAPEAPVLQAACPAGPAPVGLAVLESLGVILVANSNRFQTGDAPQMVSVFDIDDVLAGRSACLGAIPVGVFPREIHVDHSKDTIDVTNFGSQSLTTFPVSALAAALEAARRDKTDADRP